MRTNHERLVLGSWFWGLTGLDDFKEQAGEREHGLCEDFAKEDPQNPPFKPALCVHCHSATVASLCWVG